MLKIQVMGKGMIPRGYGLAPRVEPFSADLTLIQTIMSTPGLEVNMIHPEEKRTIKLTNQNLKRMWDTYSDYRPKENTSRSMTSPSTPAAQEYKKPNPVPVQNNFVEKKSETAPAVTEKKNDDQNHTDKSAEQSKPTTFKTVNADDKKSNK